MISYYDIHTHILPGIDDGSRNIEETREMLRMERDQGVLHIIATPHFTAGEHPISIEELQHALEQTREAAREIDPAMTIDLGQELLNGPGMLEALKKGEALTLAGTRYILVEFLPYDRYSVIYQALYGYIMEGYIPIVAHMERYDALKKNQNNIDELIKLGAYFQMNTESLVGGFFHREAAYHRSLVENGMIHFLGSDCHRKDYRKPLMQDALRYFSKEFRKESNFLKLVSEYPQVMLADKSL